MKINHLRQVRRDAFTLIELITVVSVIIILFAMVVGGFSFADKSAKRSRTDVVIKAARSGLEVYKEKFGAYPQVANADTTVAVAKKTYVVGGAACLYQALSGDGFDQIKGATGESIPASDGQVDVKEARNIMLENMPKEMWTKNGNTYFIVDGFGHPIQYIKAAPTISPVPGQAPPDPTTVNRGSYDIWSYGEDEVNITSTSLQASSGGSGNRLDVKWLKNW